MEPTDRAQRELMHDLRMPLQIMYSCAQMIGLELGEENAAVRSYLDMLADSIGDIRRMLANYLEEERAGMQEFRPGRGDIVGCVRRICHGWRTAAETRGVNLTFRTNCAELETEFDAEKIVRILQNLIANAVRHTPAGGRVCVRFGALGDFAEICVEDTGEGIPEDEQGKIFDPTHTCGMGLSIARRFAQMHGGVLRAESEPGKGSVFILRLPTGAARERAM